MPSFRRRASVTDSDRTEELSKTSDADDALTLAEEAEAEAAEAEAVAAAARAKAKAIRLRREAQEAEARAKAEAQTDAAAETEAETETPADATADGEAVISEEPDTAVDDQDEAPPSGRRWRFILKVVATTLGILGTIALLAASGYIVAQHRKAVDLQHLNAEYSAAARQSVVTLMSLDFNKAQEDVNRIIENTTGQFREDFESQAEDFVNVAKESKVVTDVTVTATAVESMTPDEAVVLVAATSRVTNSAGARQQPRAWRLSVDLERVDGGQVKMSKVEFVP